MTYALCWTVVRLGSTVNHLDGWVLTIWRCLWGRAQGLQWRRRKKSWDLRGDWVISLQSQLLMIFHSYLSRNVHLLFSIPFSLYILCPSCLLRSLDIKWVSYLSYVCEQILWGSRVLRGVIFYTHLTFAPLSTRINAVSVYLWAWIIQSIVDEEELCWWKTYLSF